MIIAKIAATFAIFSALAALVGASIRSPYPQIIDWRDKLFGAGILGVLVSLFIGAIAVIWS